jgi:hypothetical protein
MSDTNTQTLLLEAIQSLTADQIKIPTLPVNIFLQEALDLYEWCMPDKPKLVAAGLSEPLIESLPVRIDLCREAQAKWNMQQKMKRDAVKAWNDRSPAAFELRNQLIHDFSYAFRKSPDLMKSVTSIKKGSSNSKKIQSLVDFSKLGNANRELLAAIQFDMVLLNSLQTDAETLSSLLAQMNSEKKADNKTLVFRNRCFSYLKMAVDEIRKCGQYVFWKDENRIMGYRSEHSRKQYRKLVLEKNKTKNKADTKEI